MNDLTESCSTDSKSNTCQNTVKIGKSSSFGINQYDNEYVLHSIGL
jgi:hypothetical protein